MHLSLANLLAALAIVAVVAITLVPIATEIVAITTVDLATEQLARDLQGTRQTAVTRKLAYEITFERYNTNYIIKEQYSTGPFPRIYLPRGVEWSLPLNQTLSFYGTTGRASQGGTFILEHPSSNYRVNVVVAPRTGRIQVIPWRDD